MNIETREIALEPADNRRLMSLCGPFDDNVKQLERRLGIEINRRDNLFKLVGRVQSVEAAASILRDLYVDTAPVRGNIPDIEPDQIHLAIKESRVLEQTADSVPEYGKAVNIKTKGGVIKPRTPNQAQYIANMTLPLASARPVPVKPIWRWPQRLMRWSARRSGVSC